MPRNKYPEQTVEKILDAAAQLFLQKGYQNTTLQDIIDATKLSKGAVYHHFKSNDEIAREKPLPFKPSGGGFGGKGGKGGRGNRGRDNNRRGGYRGDRNRDDRDGGRRDFKRKSKKNSRDFENRGNKRPHRTSSEKKNGFVIRNKGDK